MRSSLIRLSILLITVIIILKVIGYEVEEFWIDRSLRSWLKREFGVSKGREFSYERNFPQTIEQHRRYLPPVSEPVPISYRCLTLVGSCWFRSPAPVGSECWCQNQYDLYGKPIYGKVTR